MIQIKKLSKLFTILFTASCIIFQIFLGKLYKNPSACPLFRTKSTSNTSEKEPLIPTQQIRSSEVQRANSLNDIPIVRTHSSVRNELVKNVFTTIANAFCSLFNKGTNHTP